MRASGDLGKKIKSLISITETEFQIVLGLSFSVVRFNACNCSIIMNAQECKTLTATHMHDSCTCKSIVASISQCVYLLNIRSIELVQYYNTYPAPEVLQFSSESVHDIG